MSFANYPVGSDYDPLAPWNETTTLLRPCEACDGTGYLYHAYNFINDTDIRCSQQTWNSLPDTYAEASRSGLQYIRGIVETCEACNGEGEYCDNPDEY